MAYLFVAISVLLFGIQLFGIESRDHSGVCIDGIDDIISNKSPYVFAIRFLTNFMNLRAYFGDTLD